jgi:hypothetical protein
VLGVTAEPFFEWLNERQKPRGILGCKSRWFRTCSLRGKAISSRKDELVRSVVTWVGLIIAILLIILGDKPFGVQIVSLVGVTEWRCQCEPD